MHGQDCLCGGGMLASALRLRLSSCGHAGGERSQTHPRVAIRVRLLRFAVAPGWVQAVTHRCRCSGRASAVAPQCAAARQLGCGSFPAARVQKNAFCSVRSAASYDQNPLCSETVYVVVNSRVDSELCRAHKLSIKGYRLSLRQA